MNNLGKKQWYALNVLQRYEKQLSEYLTRMGIENFLPVQPKEGTVESVAKERMIIPTMVFIYANESELMEVQLLPQVVQLIRLAGQSAIPEGKIETFRQLLTRSTETLELCYSPLSEGIPVRVVHGPLKGMEGDLVWMHTHSKMIFSNTPLGYIQVSMPLQNVENINLSDTNFI